MAHEPEDDVRRLWQEQPKEEMTMSLEDIRGRARKLERTIWWRNGREYIAGVVVLVGFSGMAWTAPQPLIRVGAVLVMAATVFIMEYMRRYAGTRVMPSDLALTDGIAFVRAELVRQRDLLVSLWRWYLLPPLPGMLLVLAGRRAASPGTWAGLIIAVAVLLAVFVGIERLNRWAARNVQRQIDALDASR